jgi:signal peptidase I
MSDGEAAKQIAAERAKVRESDEERWKRTKSNIKTILGAVGLAFFIRIVLFEAFEIDGPSMEPTLLNGDRVVVAKFPYGLFLPLTSGAIVSWGMPEVGDVVIVKSPFDDIDIVKRVIGVPGDQIEMRDDVVYRNGVALQARVLGTCGEEETSENMLGCEQVEEQVGDRSWRTSREPDGARIPDSMSTVIVPDGHIFVMGDHRDRSNDSRNPRVGMIPIGRVKGRALAIYWSNDSRVRWDRIFSGIR